MKNSKGMIYILVALAALTLVTVVGMLFFLPKEQPKTATPSSGTATVPEAKSTPLPDEFDPVEWTRNPQTTPLQTTPVVPSTGADGFTVTLPPETTPATQTLPPSPGATFPGDTQAPALVSPTTVPSTPVATSPVTPAKPVAKPAPKPVVKTVKVTEYWIQVASFKDRYQAENTAKALETQGLKGTLTTATVNGVSVVRVRVGPYTNEAEAGKFLSWLKPVKDFEGSYITKVSANRPR